MPTANKKITIILCLICVILLLPDAIPADAAMPQQIKIGLYYGSGAKNYYTLSSASGMAGFLADDNNAVRIFADPDLTEATIKKNTFYATECADVFYDLSSAVAKTEELRSQGYDAYCAVSDSNYTVRIGTYASFEEAQSFAELYGTYPIHYTATGIFVLKGDVIKVAVDDASRHLEIVPFSGNLSLNSVPYRGAMRFVRQTGNDMAAINILPVEEYLYSVVPKEVSPSWNEEALKAQAVAARTFTVTNFNKFSNYGFNLDNTTVSQVYGGVAAENKRTTAAVDATRGEIVKYNGNPAKVYYFASSGGKTANSEDVWSSDLPYLRSVEDTYENPGEASYASWSVTFTKEQIKETLLKKGVNIGDITDITAEYSDSGRVIKLSFIGTNGTKEYTKDNIRSPLALKSTNFTLSKGGQVSSVSVIDGSKEIISLHIDKGVFAISSSGTATLSGSLNLLSISGASAPPAEGNPDEYTFTGGGWGHGVGMSQWGAKGMADNGFTYKQILTYYFTGVQVETY